MFSLKIFVISNISFDEILSNDIKFFTIKFFYKLQYMLCANVIVVYLLLFTVRRFGGWECVIGGR